MSEEKLELLELFEKMLDQSELRRQIEDLETKAVIYSDRDRVRFNDLISEIKLKEMKLLDLMSESYIID